MSFGRARFEDDTDVTDGQYLAFGHFELDVAQRALFRQGKPLKLGSRALEMLILLAQNAGEVVSKREFVIRVWDNRAVEDVALRVHIAALRRLLKDGREGYRYIGTVSGRGYRFTANVRRTACIQTVRGEAPDVSGEEVSDRAPVATGSRRCQRVVGRAHTIQALVSKLPECGFISIVGPGGCGKTTVALAVADELRELYAQGVCFVDLGAIAEPGSALKAVALALKINGPASDSLASVLQHLQDQSVLLVLDNCEHLSEAAATLAQAVRSHCSHTHILTTSREPLRATDEWVYRLEALTYPQDEDTSITREHLPGFSAMQLFIELSRTHLHREILETELEFVAHLCRRLEGNPLAIQIAASRIDILGIRGLWESLQQTSILSVAGLRTGPPRHHTLRATFDWSYDLLLPEEQVLFRRLAVFCGRFSLDEAAHLVLEAPFRELGTVLGLLVNLCAQSLVVAENSTDSVSYRLLETSRAYAQLRLSAAGDEWAETHRRHMRMWAAKGMRWLQSELGTGTQWLAEFGRKPSDFHSALLLSHTPDSGARLEERFRLCSVWFEAVLSAECVGRSAWEELANGAVGAPRRRCSYSWSACWEARLPLRLDQSER